MALEQIGLQAILDDKQFQQGLARYTAGIGQMTKITDGAGKVIGGAFKVATGALLIGAGAIGGILATSVKAAADAEQIAAQTDAVLQSTKGVAGMTREAVGDLATALSELTPFEDDAIQGAENLLLTFTNIGKNVFPLATETVLDMSQAMGQDLKASSIQLGKALQDPVKGISALAEVGVNFTEQQKKMVEQLVKAGKVEEAQRLILKELQTEFGGAAKAAGKTFAGQLQILKNTLGNVQEEIGGALLPVLTKLAGAFVKVLADPKVKAGIKAITQGIEDLVDIFGDLIAGRNYNALFRFYYLMERVFGREIAQKIYGVMSAIGKFRDDLMDLWETTRTAFEWGGISTAVNTFVTNLARMLGAADETAFKLADIAVAITNAVLRIKTAFDTGGVGGGFSQIAKEVQAAWPAISTELSKWGAQFWDWLTGSNGALSRAAAKISEIAENILYSLPDVWSKYIQPALMGWATQFWNWLTDPSGGVLVKISENMGTLATNIENWSKDENTKERFREIGRTLAQAIIDGIGNLFAKPEKGKSLIEILLSNLWNAGISNLNAFMNFGRWISEGILAAMLSIFMSPDAAMRMAQAITTMEQNAVNGVIAQLGNILQPLFTAIQTLISTFWASHPPSAPAAPAPYSPLPSNVSQFASGGWVNRTGVALVHRGEYVIPARQAQNISNNNSRNVGTVTVNINGSTGMGASEIKKAVYAGIREVLEAA